MKSSRLKASNTATYTLPKLKIGDVEFQTFVRDVHDHFYNSLGLHHWRVHYTFDRDLAHYATNTYCDIPLHITPKRRRKADIVLGGRLVGEGIHLVVTTVVHELLHLRFDDTARCRCYDANYRGYHSTHHDQYELAIDTTAQAFADQYCKLYGIRNLF